MIKAIFIDAGHGLGPTGGIDNGAVGSGTTERAEVVEMARELITVLGQDPSFSSVRIIPIGVESRMMLKDKIAEVNAICRQENWSERDALLIAMHLNAAGSPQARGLEAWYSKGKPAARILAQALIENIARTTGLPLRPTTILTSDANRLGRLGILDDTVATGCLVECGFVTNEFDARLLKDAALDDRFAQGLHQGLRHFLSLPIQPSAPGTLPPAFFSDVPEIAWYHGDVRLCLEEGIFQMSADGRFHPERTVSRAELATVIARHLTRQHGNQ